MSIKILLAVSNQMISEGLRLLFEKQREMEVVAEARDIQRVVQITWHLSPDVVIMEMSVPVSSCIQATRQIVARDPAVKVVVLSIHSHGQFIEATFRAGARGYVLIRSAFGELLQCIEAVMTNQRYVSPMIAKMMLNVRLPDGPRNGASVLSRRELEVFELLAQGRSKEEIASILGVSVKTLKRHHDKIMAKLDVHSGAQLVRFTFLEGMV